MQNEVFCTSSHLLMILVDMDVYLMIHKSKSFEKFKEFKNEVQNQLGKSIKTF